MLKKILVLFIVAFFLISCSRLESRNDKIEDVEFIKHYDSWEMQQMEEVIQKHIVIDGYSGNVPKYQSMLEEKKRAKKELENLVSTVREEILENNLTTLENNMANGLRNIATIRELRRIDFTIFRIYTSKVKYNKSSASNIVALNLGEETFYYDVNYEYTKEKWKIVDFKERR